MVMVAFYASSLCEDSSRMAAAAAAIAGVHGLGP
jgi:hypothetical protein